MIYGIVVIDKSWGIGKDGHLLFSLKKDMQYFKEKTEGNFVVMGYNTCLSLPGKKPLSNRTNLVLCPKDVELPSGFIRVNDINEILQLDATAAAYNDKYPGSIGNIYIIGGGMMYRSMLPYCDKIFVTKVDAEKEADTFFPNLDTDTSFELIEESELIDDNGYKIKFTTYVNNNKQSL